MCLIVVGKKRDIKELDFSRIWNSNSDGAGILIPHRTRPVVIKGLMKLKDFKSAFESIKYQNDICIHFRQATHGAVSKSNTHPFRIDDKSYLMHNGILSGLGQAGDNGYSDSAHLAAILSKVDPKDRKDILRLVPGKYAYVNRNNITVFGGFTEENNLWLSNTYWKPYVYKGKHACNGSNNYGIYNHWDEKKIDWDKESDYETIVARSTVNQDSQMNPDVPQNDDKPETDEERTLRIADEIMSSLNTVERKTTVADIINGKCQDSDVGIDEETGQVIILPIAG